MLLKALLGDNGLDSARLRSCPPETDAGSMLLAIGDCCQVLPNDDDDGDGDVVDRGETCPSEAGPPDTTPSSPATTISGTAKLGTV